MKYTKTEKNGCFYYANENGPVIGMSVDHVKEKDGLAFRNLSKTEELLPYEDWRLPDETRAADLASRLSVEEIAGLMLYSSHQAVPFRSGGPFQGHYNGKAYEEGEVPKWQPADEQKLFLENDHIRHILLFAVDDADTSSRWSNELQKIAEQLPWGIPVNISSDPRHGVSAESEYKSTGKGTSRWPEGMGLAATFSEDHYRNYAHAVSAEYRAMGITTALGPQIDLATDPRWMRLEDTWGGNPDQVMEMTRIICDELQTTDTETDGWGKDSILTMVKHWPGGGAVEGGRDAHYPFGKFSVYPGGKFETHKNVFAKAAFHLDGPTGSAASVMPYYTVSWDQDPKNGENVGNSYSEYLIKDLLRERCGYDGVVCTDWGITGDPMDHIDSFSSRCYGVEALSVAERHLRIILNGIDQFGGNNQIEPILEAYAIGCERYGEPFMRDRMEQSARRLLRNMFRIGLFENPYLDPVESDRIVGSETFVTEGYEAQKASVVLLKNKKHALPLSRGIRVYVPGRTIRARKNFFRMMTPQQQIDPLRKEACTPYFLWAETPEEADAAILFIESPLSDGYSEEDAASGGNGYVPISLQYRPYQAEAARIPSIAGGDFRESFTDRSYHGKTGTAANESDLDLVLNTRKAMGDKPVIVCIRMHNPCVLSELEPSADAVLAEFGVQKEALLDLIFGDASPAGKLPVILPESMETVERHCEDIADDIIPYTDTEGNVYGYKFGLTYSDTDEIL